MIQLQSRVVVDREICTLSSPTAIRIPALTLPSSSLVQMGSPQVLKDLTAKSKGQTGLNFLRALTNLVNAILEGKVPFELRPYFCVRRNPFTNSLLFFEPVHHCCFLKKNLPVDWDSGLKGAPYKSRRPRVCVFSPKKIVHMTLDWSRRSMNIDSD